MRIVNAAIAFSVLAFLSVCVWATVPVILVFRAVLTSQLKKRFSDWKNSHCNKSNLGNVRG